MRLLGYLAVASVFVFSACAGNSGSAPTSTEVPPTTPATTPTSSSTVTTTLGTTTSTTSSVDDPGHLLVVGDWGSGTLPQGAVAGAMLRYAEDHDVTAILTTGDNFYSDDWEFLMEPFGWVARQNIPFWIVWGNHDVESAARIQAVDRAFDDPPRWALHQWGAIDVIVLDSTDLTSTSQAEFLLETMATSDKPAIVTLHHPPYSCSHRESAADFVNQTVGILDDDVFMVLAGHDHSYQRFANESIAYVVTGGGGAALTELGDCAPNHPALIAGASTHHFLAMHQTEESVEVEVLDVNGEQIDSFAVALP